MGRPTYSQFKHQDGEGMGEFSADGAKAAPSRNIVMGSLVFSVLE